MGGGGMKDGRDDKMSTCIKSLPQFSHISQYSCDSVYTYFIHA